MMRGEPPDGGVVACSDMGSARRAFLGYVVTSQPIMTGAEILACGYCERTKHAHCAVAVQGSRAVVVYIPRTSAPLDLGAVLVGDVGDQRLWSPFADLVEEPSARVVFNSLVIDDDYPEPRSNEQRTDLVDYIQSRKCIYKP